MRSGRWTAAGIGSSARSLRWGRPGRRPATGWSIWSSQMGAPSRPRPVIRWRTAGASATFAPGDVVDGSPVATADLVPYAGEATYDIVVSGATGTYFIDGVALGSTLRP